MAIVLKDRVKETASAPGTGTITLGGAASGFQAFSAIGNGNVTYFAIVDAAAGTWEVNYGTYTSSGTTLTRNATPLSSSNAGALVNFTGLVDVFCTYPSEKAIYEETSGNVLIDGGPITVVGNGVTSYTTFSAALGEMYANINNFAQFYAQNLNSGSEASTDIVAYNDEGDGTYNFIDMGINSSNYTSATYPIFTASSGYVYNDGGELLIGTATAAKDVMVFGGGVDEADEIARFKPGGVFIVNSYNNASTGEKLQVYGTAKITGATTFGSTVLLNADPTLNLQAATKQYVDTAVSTGLHLHQPVLVATTGNLTATYNNGSSGVGATLTNSSTQVALSIDGVSLSVNDRVLVWQQSTAAQNGIYVVTTVGSGSTNWVLTRASDADTYVPQSDTGLGGGDYFYVQSGTTGAGDSYVCTNDGTITFGTTAITFAQFSGAITYTGGTNIDVTGQVISLTGTVAATNGGTGTATVTTGDLLYGSATNTWSKLAAGAAYKSLVMNAGGTNVEWNAVALNQSGSVSGALPATNGGTGLNSYNVGELIYSNTTTTFDVVTRNTTTTKKFLTQTGTGSAAQAPVWGTIDGADVTGNISGSAGSVANALTLGTYLTGTSFNGSSAVTATVDATSANTASKVVARDGSGNFSAGTITATLSGNATTATTATNLAGGTANQIPYQTSAGTTAYITAASGTNYLLNYTGSAFSWVATSGLSVSSAATATALATPRAIYGNNFDGTAALTQVIASTYGGTGNGFTKFTGPTSSEKTFTLPDASSTIVVQGGALGTPSSGTLSGCTVDGTNGVGFLNIPQNAQTGSYTLVLGDSGKHIYHAVGAGAATYTIPANSSVAYPIGTAISFVNLSATSISIAITTDTMYLAGFGTTGTRTLAQYGTATALKLTSTVWIISGNGLT